MRTRLGYLTPSRSGQPVAGKGKKITRPCPRCGAKPYRQCGRYVGTEAPVWTLIKRLHNER